MIASGPFRGLFLFLGAAEFLHLIATRGASPQGPEKRLEFCEISHERGARSPANAPRDRTPLPPAHPGWAAARRHSPRRGGAAGGPGYPGTPPAGRLPRGGAAAQPPPGGAGYPGRRRAPCTGHVRGGYPRRLPARAGRLPGKTGRCPGRTARLAGRLPCGVATPAAYTACAGAATGRAGAGRRATPGRRGGTATPGGRYPRRLPRRSWRSYAASCDGYAPTSWGRRLPKPGLPGAARGKRPSGARPPGENHVRPPFARI